MKMKLMKAIAVRKAQGLTALDLAEKTGIREQRIFQLERGRCRLGTDEARRWAKALGVEVKAIFPDLEV